MAASSPSNPAWEPDRPAWESDRDEAGNPYRYFSRADAKAFYAISPWRIFLDSCLTWALILGSIWLWAEFRHPLAFLAAFVTIASRQHALNTFVHEASHFNISRNKRWNDLISDIFYAAPHLISTEGYRGKHLDHHRYLGDPVLDQEFKARYVIRGWHFLKHSFFVVTGKALFEAANSYVPSLSSNRTPRLRYLFLVALTNSALAAYCYWLGAPLAYFYLWLLPLFTLTLYLSTLRVIAEHQSHEYALRGREDFKSNISPPFIRTISAGPVERFFFSPLYFCYHCEHHWFPAVPYTQLPKLHRKLKEEGYYAWRPAALGSSYFGVLKSLISPPKQRQAG